MRSSWTDLMMRRRDYYLRKENVLLDPYARAVTGQRNWGERPEGGADFIYHARVVENNFDWGRYPSDGASV